MVQTHIVHWTKVHDAVEGGDWNKLQQVLQDNDQRWAIDQLGNLGEPPIHLAIALCRPDAVEQLMAAGADVNRKDFLGLTPLMYATQKNNAECVRLLLGDSNCKRNVNMQGSGSGYSALHFAMECASPEVVALLLGAGASTTTRTK